MASLFPPGEILWISDATATFTTGNKVAGPQDHGCSKLRTRPVTSHASYRLRRFGARKDPWERVGECGTRILVAVECCGGCTVVSPACDVSVHF